MRELISSEELLSGLNELIEAKALELKRDAAGHCVYIPYMMSDAVEYYFVLTDCSVHGTFDFDVTDDTMVEITSREVRTGLFIHGQEGITSIWYTDCIKSVSLYQYHRSGHFWVEGQERLRRIVYMIGTAADKLQYLGRSFVNETEMRYIPLLGFGPLRYFSPIDESLDEWYEETEAGAETMEDLAGQAGDMELVRLIGWYRKAPGTFMRGMLEKRLADSKSRQFISYLETLIELGSLEYDMRDYGLKLNSEMERRRESVSKELISRGYTGSYPHFQDDKHMIHAVEELPFTLLEREGVEFDIHLMVYEMDGKSETSYVIKHFTREKI